MANVNFQIFTNTSTSALPQVRPIDIGDISNTGSEVVQTVYIKHNYPGSLKRVGLYITPYADNGYVGIYGESEDYNRVLEWGNEPDKGLVMNFDTNTSTDYDVKVYYDGTDGTGYSYLTNIPLGTKCFLGAASTAEGHFPAGATAKVTFKINVPSTEVALGQGMFSVKVFYEV